MVSLNITSTTTESINNFIDKNWLILLILIGFAVWLIYSKYRKPKTIKGQKPLKKESVLPTYEELEERRKQLEAEIHKRNIEYDKWLEISQFYAEEYERTVRMMTALKKEVKEK